jgi:predicted nucleic acid-binding protein
MKVLADSGALLAMVDAKDGHHRAAARFVQNNPSAMFYLPELIFAETMILVKARLGAKAAVELGFRIRQSSHFQIVYPTMEERQMVWKIFSRYTDKDWSYADCSLLALARRLNVFEVFAFDRHIGQMPELNRLPRLR